MGTEGKENVELQGAKGQYERMGGSVTIKGQGLHRDRKEVDNYAAFVRSRHRQPGFPPHT